MTTAHTPLRVLTQQAQTIAKTLKQAERGEKIANDPNGKIAAARRAPNIVFGIAMDDKFLKITMTWDAITATSEVGIAAYILKQMKGVRGPVN